MRERTLFERRFSCRRFSDRAIGRDLIERLLEAAVWAPWCPSATRRRRRRRARGARSKTSASGSAESLS